jgi:hypothetical protein
MMEDSLSILEAYKAMVLFIEDYYFRFGQDSLGSVLGDMQLQPNGTTADPAAWFDWLDAVKKVLEERKG